MILAKPFLPPPKEKFAPGEAADRHRRKRAVNKEIDLSLPQEGGHLGHAFRHDNPALVDPL
jgi:hypothetical protein